MVIEGRREKIARQTEFCDVTTLPRIICATMTMGGNGVDERHFWQLATVKIMLFPSHSMY